MLPAARAAAAGSLEQLGPTFVKAGQMLRAETVYVPLEYAEALGGLQAHVAPFPAAEAVAIVEAELGAPLRRAVRQV